MPPQTALLSRICDREETLIKAQDILRIAQTKTGPGSGHDLGPNSTGLLAICAFLASEKLGNGDVTSKSAQLASCLKPSTFNSVLNIVRSALAFSNVEDLSYKNLAKTHRFDQIEKVVSWMEQIENTLLGADPRWEQHGDAVTCVVFSWTCRVILDKDHIDLRAIAREHHIPPKTLKPLWVALDNTCEAVSERIIKEVSRMRIEIKRTHAASSSKKAKAKDRSLTSSPSKRKASFSDIDTDIESNPVPETPTKRRKLQVDILAASSSKLPALTEESEEIETGAHSEKEDTAKPIALADRTLGPSRSAHVRAPATPTPSRSRYKTSTTHKEIILDEEESESAVESEPEDDDLLRSRHFRPVFLDATQWTRRDPRLEKEWQNAQENTRAMVEYYGHPFEQFRPLTVT